ncbi:L-2-amino-thiazoline-4-carboxylic acid hydrolase [Rhodovastum atsumiense]|nr:L-2-amino-thiazoline-4-carboxylic acid hydrolase [Rhodovastum atsumiense]
MPTQTTMAATEVHALLRRAFAMRAAFYARMFEVLRAELGRERAMTLMKEATRQMGEKAGAGLAGHGPADLAGLSRDFLGGIIEGETLFSPELRRCDEAELTIHFHRCPLKEAWQAEGCGDADLKDLCEIAGAIDQGMFTAAGFTFAGETWQPGREGCCTLRVLPGKD